MSFLNSSNRFTGSNEPNRNNFWQKLLIILLVILFLLNLPGLSFVEHTKHRFNSQIETRFHKAVQVELEKIIQEELKGTSLADLVVNKNQSPVKQKILNLIEKKVSTKIESEFEKNFILCLKTK